MVNRAFRYQTGETIDIVHDLRRDGMVEVDVIAQNRIQPFLEDIEGLGIFVKTEMQWDYEAINFYDNHDFVCRVFVKDSTDSTVRPLYIDFYSDYTEDTYDSIFFG